MEEINLWIKISVGLFTGFLIVLVYSMVREQVKMTYFSLVLLLLSLGSGAYTAYIFVTKSYHRIKDLAELQKKYKYAYPYYRMFGETDNLCLQFQHHGTTDGSVQVVSDVVALHFYTCPQEMQRILSQIPHTATIVSASSVHDDLHPSWFQLSDLGDSIRVFSRVSNSEKNRWSHTIYSSLDSSQAYYISMHNETSF